MPKHSSGCRTCLHGAAPPQGPTLTLLYTIFNEKGIPFAFRIPFTD